MKSNKKLVKYLEKMQTQQNISEDKVIFTIENLTSKKKKNIYYTKFRILILCSFHWHVSISSE